MNKISVISMLFLFAGCILNVPHVNATQTTMEVSPRQGSFNDTFEVGIIIDGHGDIFNAAEANVTLSSNLSVKDLTLGDCNFSYLTTPSSENLSFSGVILSGSSKKCIVYTMSLIPTSKGKGSVTLSKGSVRRYGDAAEILSTSNNGTYTLTGVSSSKPAAKQAKTEDKSLYTVTINVLAKKDEPLSDASITLTSPDTKKTTESKTDQQGNAQFTEVKEGIYQAVIKKDNREVANTIVNVKGTNQNLTFGINIENQKNNPLLGNTTLNILGLSPIHLGGILVLGIVLGIGTTVLIMKKGHKKHNQGS